MTARITGKRVRAIGPHEREALDREYRQHAPWLRAVARHRTGSHDVAEDLVQEAYLRAARYSTAQRSNPRSLLVCILSNLIKDRFRSKARERVGLAKLSVRPDSIEGQHPQQEELLSLRNAILGMPDPLRQVFLLARFTPATQTEIAKRLNISVKTVEWRLAKALDYCARVVGE